MDEPWRIAYFIRHPDDDRAQAAPGHDFIESCPREARATLSEILIAVAAGPPPTFPGGAMWQAMHGGLRGFHEVRHRHRRLLFRVFCRVDRDPATGRNLLTVIDGAVKPVGTALPPSVYTRVRCYGDEYLSRSPRSTL